MIPKEYQHLHMWIRMNNRILVEMQRNTSPGAVWNSGYIHGARYLLKQLARQWAYDVRARRKHEEKASRN